MSAVDKVHVAVRGGVIHVRGYHDGKRIQRSSGKKDNKTNMDWVRRNAQQVLLNDVVKKQEVTTTHLPTLEQYGNEWLALNKNKWVDNTFLEYRRDFKSFILPYFGSWEIDTIKTMHLKKWQSNLLDSKKATRFLAIRNIFNGILKEAFYDELIEKNPFERIKRPRKEKPKIDPFSLKEVELLLKSSKGWFHNYLKISFFTGIRTGEMLALRWEDIDFDNDIINIRHSMRKGKLTHCKTDNSIRDLDMLPLVKNALLAQKELTGSKQNVFVTQYGKPYMRADKISSSQWKPLLEECHLKHRILYKTRHTFASVMIQRGEEIAWVSKMMGHANIGITLEKYARYIPRKDVKRAVFLNELEL